MDDFEKLAQLFTRFPGIGTRQARRFAYFILRADNSYARSLLSLIGNLREQGKECPLCHRMHWRKDTLCLNCANPETDTSILFVVEKETDCEAVLRSGAYHGRFF